MWPLSEGNYPKNIFSDFTIDSLQPDLEGYGLFLKATKPEEFRENDLSNFSLYSIVSRRRIKRVTFLEIILTRTFYPVALLSKKILKKILPVSIRRTIRKKVLDKIP